MAVQVLSHANAYNTGSDLWLAPSLVDSKWTRRLDWYLNFQVIHSHFHQSQNKAAFLNQTLQATEFPETLSAHHNLLPLMISSSQLLPNKWTVFIEYQNQPIEKWLKQASEVYQGLNQPTVRIFLPPQVTNSQIEKVLVSYFKVEDVTLVLD